MFWINEKNYFNFSVNLSKDDEGRISVFYFNKNQKDIIKERFVRNAEYTNKI